MRTVEVKVYSFDELSESAKQKAISSNSEINLQHEWWESVYEDAEICGLKIESFDLDRNRHCEGYFIENAYDSAFKFKENHGAESPTHILSAAFIDDYNKLVEKYSDGVQTDKVADNNEYEFDLEANDLEDEYLKSLLEEYSLILQKEYEYLSSEEAIAESLRINSYEFTEDGEDF